MTAKKITVEDIEMGRARWVRQGGMVTAERVPPGTQYRVPLPRQDKGGARR